MLKVIGLTKHFPTDHGDVRAVTDVEFGIGQGEVVTLLGPSGCGKTTLLRSIAGLEKPDAGTIEIDGVTVYDENTNVPPHDRPIAMVFQSYAIWPHMNVFENVAYPLKVGKEKISKAQVSERVHTALELVRIPELADRSATMLSGGQQQRVAVARALVREPKLLLLDEPLSNLDAKLRDEMRLEFKEMFRRLNQTALYVTHDLSEAMVISDLVVVLNAGKIAQMGLPKDVYSRPDDRFVADFMGAGNVLDAVVDSVDEARLNVRVAFGMITCIDNGRSLAPETDLTVAIRPEAVGLTRSPGTYEHRCSIQTEAFLGSTIEYTIRIGDHWLRARMPMSAETFAPGEEVWASINPESVMIVGVGRGSA